MHGLTTSNNNSPKKLNSIHHKRVINTGKVEGTNSVSYNTSCNDEMRWGEDANCAGDEDYVDDVLDDSRDDGDDDGNDLPLREVFSPTKSARRKGLFFSVGFRHRAAAELRKLFFF